MHDGTSSRIHHDFTRRHKYWQAPTTKCWEIFISVSYVLVAGMKLKGSMGVSQPQPSKFAISQGENGSAMYFFRGNF